jgi:uncharacterized membrane protein YiaA
MEEQHVQVVVALDLPPVLDDAGRDALRVLPELGWFLLILVLGVVGARVVQRVLQTVLQKAGFDQLVERGGVRQALSRSKYDAAGILARIVYYVIFLLVLSAAFDVFGPNAVSAFLEQVVFFLPRLFVAVLVLVLAAAVAAAVKDLLANALGGLPYGGVLAQAASLFIVAIGVLTALDQLRIAPLIVGGIYYALLALVVVPPIIAFGVGGIEPARDAIRAVQARSRRPPGDAPELPGAAGADPEPR